LRNYIFYSRGKQIGASVLLVLIVTLVALSVRAWVGYRVPAFMLLVTVSVLAMFFDIVPVLIAATLSALLWDFLFIPPTLTFTVGTPEDRLLLAMYFFVALINGVLTIKIRDMERKIKLKDDNENAIKLYTTLFNSLTHELRTPITAIIGSVDNLLSQSPRLTEKDKHELLEEISTAALRLHQQVENLLSMSRLESGMLHVRTDWSDINELIYKTLQRLEPQLKAYKMIVEIPEHFPLFKIDFGLMEQVLYNLLLNVKQHTPAGTTVRIHVRHEEKRLILVVEDDGVGFPHTDIDKVFDKFYRVKGSSTGGTGLGLSIVKGFVEAHGGIVKLERLQEKGSRFTIAIPAVISPVNRFHHE
jgi:two-component system sensor histidine kinase KdpD